LSLELVCHPKAAEFIFACDLVKNSSILIEPAVCGSSFPQAQWTRERITGNTSYLVHDVSPQNSDIELTHKQ
jgi:hypothetical protein